MSNKTMTKDSTQKALWRSRECRETQRHQDHGLDPHTPTFQNCDAMNHLHFYKVAELLPG